jgi:hypothetical protein
MLLKFFLPNLKIQEEKNSIMNNEKNKQEFSFSYVNQQISFLEKIQCEKRRRNQIYLPLDYFIGAITYFDFFSFDAFQTVKSSKLIAEILDLKVVNIEFLLIAFFYKNPSILKIAQEYKITDEIALNLLSPELKSIFYIKTNFLYLNFVKKLKNIFFSYKEQTKEKTEILYSPELNLIFKKAAENALKRFKTPIVTSEILFLTLLESENYKVNRLIKLLQMNGLNFYLLKYKLLKLIHNGESVIKEKIIKNQQYFAYLLKTQLSSNEFEKLFQNELLSTGVSLFRNMLILQILQINIFEYLKNDINKSIKIMNKRKYSN